jgi:hypothetical protein
MCTAASWHFPNFQGFDRERHPFSFRRHTPRMRDIQYSARPIFFIDDSEYWIVRFRGR